MSDLPNQDVAIFAELIQLPAGERAAYLDKACAGDNNLRGQVEALLKVHDRIGDFLEQSPAEGVRREPEIGERPGTFIGRYKLLEQIGEGGCGVVYLAEQEKPVRRQVALKVIKPGMDTRNVIARFEAERQVLALMDHPNIAKVFDAGATESGRPYFVMELVRGTKITTYCDQNALTTKERLKLFVQVCRAIQHAHQKGIIHRDIKPSNVLVTKSPEGEASPVVIDFGIAKATTDQRLTDKTIFTALEMLIGTPAYMSPEQAEVTGVDLDTRTDIYSLGVLLYELLAGSTPFDGRALIKAGLDEIRRTIREKEPDRPSTRLGKLTEADLTQVAHVRKSEARTLIRGISGDLDWIVMKALEKDRSRRYETAHGLALDVQRFLAQEPVLARPPSAFYKVQKAALRNKILLTAAGAIALLLLGSLIVVSLALSKERQSRREAVAASAKSKQVTTFLEDMLNRAGPAVARGRDTTMMLDILNETAARVGTEMKNQPAVEAELRDLIGKLYEQIGKYPQAEEMERVALSIRLQEFGPESLQAATSLHDLAEELQAQYKYMASGNLKLPEAEKDHEQALAIRRRLLGDENADTATSLNDLGAVYREERKLKEAEALAREALQTRRKLFGQENVDVADSLRNLSITLGSEGRWGEAKKTAEEALAIRRKVLGPDHPFVASSLEDVAWAASGLGQHEEALRLDGEALLLQQRLFGDTHPAIGRTLNAMGQLISARGDLTASDAVLSVALSIQRRVLGDDNQATLETLDALARVLNAEDKAPEAESVAREAVAAWGKWGGGINSDRMRAMRDLCEALEHQNKWPEAVEIWRESVALWRKHGDFEDKESMYTLRRLGLALEAEHNWPDAESVHREAWAISRKKGEEDSEALVDLERVVRVLMYEKKFAEVQGLLAQALTPTFVTQPSSGGLLAQRLAIMGRRGRWREAAADAAQDIANQPTDHYLYHTLAGLLAVMHDRPGYEQLCQKLLPKFANTENPYVAERVAEDCLLLPNSGVDLEIVDKLADTAVTHGSGEPALPYFQACKAMSSYRRGHFREATEWAEKAVKTPTADGLGQGKAFAVLAMANWELGKKSEARAALAKGNSVAPAPSPGAASIDLGESWVAWLQARVSLDEAEAKINALSTTERKSNQE